MALNACQLCLLASFDEVHGAELVHSVPLHTGIDEATAAQRMVPERLHDTDSDWTVLLVPVAQLTGLAVRPLRHAHVLGRHASSALYGGAHLYILSYSRTVHDACAPRGGRLCAVALGTMHPYLDMFKPALVLAMDAYTATRDLGIVERLFNEVNTLRLASLPALAYSEKLASRSDHVLWRMSEQLSVEHGLDRITASRAFVRHWLGQASLEPMSLMTLFLLQSHARRSAAQPRRPMCISEPLRTALPPTHATRMTIGNAHVPVNVPLYLFPEEVSSYSLIRLLTAFERVSGRHAHLHSNGQHTHPNTVLFNALVTHKRVLFVTCHARASVVVDCVLSACAFASGCGSLLRGFLDTAVPYATLADIDELRARPSFIAGATHPRLVELGCWDVLCDVEARSITVSDALRAPRPFAPARPIAAEKRRSRMVVLRRAHSVPADRWAAGDERSFAPERRFMQALADAARRSSEAFVRYWCQAYVRDFVAQVTRHELLFLGNSPLALPGELCAWPREDALAIVRANAMRAEAWRDTPSYVQYVADVARMRGAKAARTGRLI